MVFITGDTHGEIDIGKLNSRNFNKLNRLKKSDYVIIAGDFGFIWSNDNTQKYWLNWFEKKPYTTLFIDGNHENFDLLKKYDEIEWNNGIVHKINNSVYHLMRGSIFKIDGLKIFTFGGAKSVDKIYRKEHISWWKEEEPNQREYEYGLYNLEANDYMVDVVITHSAPNSVLKNIDINNEYAQENKITSYLEAIKQKLK